MLDLSFSFIWLKIKIKICYDERLTRHWDISETSLTRSEDKLIYTARQWPLTPRTLDLVLVSLSQTSILRTHVSDGRKNWKNSAVAACNLYTRTAEYSSQNQFCSVVGPTNFILIINYLCNILHNCKGQVSTDKIPVTEKCVMIIFHMLMYKCGLSTKFCWSRQKSSLVLS